MEPKTNKELLQEVREYRKYWKISWNRCSKLSRENKMLSKSAAVTQEKLSKAMKILESLKQQ